MERLAFMVRFPFSSKSTPRLLPFLTNAQIYTACSSSTSAGYAEVEKAVAETSPNTKVIPYPLSQKEELVLQLLDDILNLWGRLDIWVCSAGQIGPATIATTSPSDLQNCLETTSLAPFFALKYGPPAMAKKSVKGSYPNAAPKDGSYGSIIVISSIASGYGGEESSMISRIASTDYND
jgi:NAD(P)-dependent dehydrogenase (short-subunit alcohol dehydrogenase family)